MRKIILLSGAAILPAAPAVACDLEMLGGPQRYNAFAAYGTASHVPTASQTPSEAQPEQRPQAETAQPTEAAQPTSASAEDAEQAKRPSTTVS